MSVQVVHLTSVHSRYDTRIFLKQCHSLEQAGYVVSLVVADGNGDEVRDNINIIDVGAPTGRLDRMFNVCRRVFEKAKQLDADIYHFHDPELMPVGLKLKKLSKRVIFDSHEDVPKQILYKQYLSKPSRWMISQVISRYESWACRRFDVIIAATPFIADKFRVINPETFDINNFPILGELAYETINWPEKKHQVCFVGAISAERGIVEIVDAMDIVSDNLQLQLVGKFSEAPVEHRVKKLPGWSKVKQLGYLGRDAVRDVLNLSIAGLVTFYPLPNHIDAQPNKMFEYMSAGVPVIGSNFPFWREIIEGNNCGVCVDPLAPEQIAKAIDFLNENPDKAEEMGVNGQRAVQELYNWSVEEKKLLKLYQTLH